PSQHQQAPPRQAHAAAPRPKAAPATNTSDDRVRSLAQRERELAKKLRAEMAKQPPANPGAGSGDTEHDLPMEIEFVDDAWSPNRAPRAAVGASAIPPVDDAAVRAAGIRKLEGRRVTLYTDLPSQPEVDDLPDAFDAAF